MTDSLLLRPQRDLAAIARQSPVRWTHLRHFFESPAHYLASFNGPQKDTEAMRIGRAVDAYVLGGEEPLIFPAKRQGAGWERFKAFHAGREILTVAENDAARYAADAIEANRDAMAVLRGGAAHPSLSWKHGARQCVSHPDYVARSFVTELKVVSSADPKWLIASARKSFYPEQLALYDNAARYADVAAPSAHYLVAVEYDVPFSVTVLSYRPEVIAAAKARIADAFERLRRCEESDRWPSYAESVVEVAD